jgi:hypothetical protein
MSTRYLFLTMAFLFASAGSTLYPLGLHLINQTRQILRYYMNTDAREYSGDLQPGQSYYFSFYPNNMTLYSPQGTCSVFYNIGMNPSVFDTLVIRPQANNPGCCVIGYIGRTRQRSSATTCWIPFEPNYCRRGCWNPATGAAVITRTTGILTGPGGTQPTTFSGTELSEPNPTST